MTREKEKEIVIAATHYEYRYNADSKVSQYCCFRDGAKWADDNPKCPWISVDNALPCDYKELLLSTGYCTVSVFAYKKGGACSMDNMIMRNGKWEWAWKENYLYWMPIPELPKE